MKRGAVGRNESLKAGPRLLAFATAVAIMGNLVVVSGASARDFGSAPLTTIKNEAGITRCTGLTKNELAAMMLAPTWDETGAGSSGAPSPMAMSRYDLDQDLYSFNTTATEVRVYWHPGIGLWQLDDAGFASQLTANQRIAVATAANKVAVEMKNRYCNASGTDAARRAAAFAPWFACGGSNCESIYQSIYCSGSDTVCNITTLANPGGWGGMSSRTCRFRADTSTSFNCWYVDINGAQGDTSVWKQDPKTGSGSISPLTFAFYVWADGTKEVRDWIIDDTGYGREVRASRTLGANSRNGLDWKEPAAPLCETSPNHRGTCS